MSQINIWMVLLAIFGYIITYLSILAVYRLYFSPLARFPGPKLTAATGLYEVYFNLVKGGQFFRKIPEWHEKYGPIVRINPIELHISDPEFYENIYTTDRRDRLPNHSTLPTVPYSAHATTDYFLHRHRRGALNPLFSKPQVQKLVPFIQSRVDIIIGRFNNEYKTGDKVLNLGNAFTCFTTDVAMEFAFGTNYNFCGAKNFTSDFQTGIEGLLGVMHWTSAFPVLAAPLNLMLALPHRFLMSITPEKSQCLLMWLEDIRIKLREVMREAKEKSETTNYSTVFHSIMFSDLPPEEKTERRLHDEAQVVIGAGGETTKATLTVAMFHILDQPNVHSRLKAEILSVFPDVSSPPSLATLEKLPYLVAVTQEALRLSYGALKRLPRLAPHKALEYTDPTNGRHYVIPIGTPLSSAAHTIHHNEAIFPSSHEFIPERWLADPITGELAKFKNPSGEEKFLSRYLVSFTKGDKMCPGTHVAYAELYIMLANLIRKCDFELWETNRDAMEIWAEALVAIPKPGTAVRVKVL